MKLTKGKKWLIGIGLALGFLFLSAQLLISLMVEPVLERAIRETVRLKSDRLYQVDSLDMRFNIARRTLTVSRLSIGFDSARLATLKNTNQEPSNVFRVSAPRTEIELLNLYDAVFKQEFDLNAIRVFQPEIRMIPREQTPSSKQTYNASERKGLYNLISDRIKSLHIGHVEVKEGTFHITNRKIIGENAFEAKELTVLISNFRLDSTCSKDWRQPFYADEIRVEVNVNDYYYILPDSSYLIKAGKLGVSTTRGEVYAEDLQIRPNYQHFEESHLNGPVNLIEAYVKRFQLGEVKVQKFFEDRELEIGSVRIIEPNVFQIGQVNPDSANTNALAPAALYRQIQPFAKTVQIDGLSIERGQFHKLRQLGDTTRTLGLSGIGMYLYRVKLDSTLKKGNRKLFFAEDIDLKVDEYLVNLNNNAYTLMGGKSGISTFDRLVYANDLHLTPVRKKYRQARHNGLEVVECRVPSLEISGLDLYRAWYDRRVEVSQINISDPSVNLLNYPRIDKDQVASLAQTNLYELISGYLNSFAVRNLSIEGGRLNVQDFGGMARQIFSTSDLTVAIDSFRLDPQAFAQTNNPFYADNISINLKIDDYSLLLADSSYAIQVQNIGISTEDSTIYADSLRLIPQEKLIAVDTGNIQIWEVLAPRVELSGFDAYKAYIENELDIHRIRVQKPRIDLASYQRRTKPSNRFDLDSLDLYAMIKDGIRALQIGRFDIDSAMFVQTEVKDTLSIQRTLPNIGLSILDFQVDSTSVIDPDRMLYAGDIRLQIRDVGQALPDSMHHFQLAGLEFSTKNQRITLDSIRISPRDTTSGIGSLPAMSQAYHIDIPKTVIDGVNTYQLYQEKVLDVNRILINNPSAILTNLPEIEKDQIDSLSRVDPYQLISKTLKSINVSTFIVQGGTYTYHASPSDTAEGFHANDILVFMTDFQLDSTARSRTGNPFYARDINIAINVNDYSFIMPDSSYEVQVKNIGVSTADSSIFAEDLKLIPRKSHPNLQKASQYFEIEIPWVWLKGIKANEVYFERKLRLDSLKLQSPIIQQVKQHFPGSQGTKNKDLYALLSPRLDTFSIGNIEISHGNFTQVLPPSDTTNPVSLPDFSVSAQQFLVDSMGNLRPGRLFFSDNVHAQLHDYSFITSDSLYTVKTNNIGMITGDHILYADSLQLIPNHSIASFADKYGYTKDRIHVKSHMVRALHTDLYRLFTQNEIDLDRLTIDGLHLDVTKDKRLPPKPNKRPLFPQEIVARIDPYLHIDSIYIADGTIDFRVWSENMHIPGHFHLSNLDATLTNITNDSTLVQSGNTTGVILDANAHIMDKGKMNVKFRYVFGDTAHAYTFFGSLGGMDLVELNPILEPEALVRIKAGQTDSVFFQVNGNNKLVRGKMKFWYDGLKVVVINEKGKEQPEIERRRFATVLANALVVKNNNPNRRFLRVGRIEYEVEKDKGFVAHWTKGIISGMKSSVGLKNKEEKDKTLGLKWLLKKRR